MREGETVTIVYDQLKKVRRLYRDNGWMASQIRDHTREPSFLLWEWVDRIPVSERPAFMDVREWDDGDEFIYRQIVTLYRYAPPLRRKKPSWGTVREWRKRYKGFLKHGTPDGLPPKI